MLRARLNGTDISGRRPIANRIACVKQQTIRTRCSSGNNRSVQTAVVLAAVFKTTKPCKAIRTTHLWDSSCHWRGDGTCRWSSHGRCGWTCCRGHRRSHTGTCRRSHRLRAGTSRWSSHGRCGWTCCRSQRRSHAGTCRRRNRRCGGTSRRTHAGT
jgi:hypothetical protein